MTGYDDEQEPLLDDLNGSPGRDRSARPAPPRTERTSGRDTGRGGTRGSARDGGRRNTARGNTSRRGSSDLGLAGFAVLALFLAAVATALHDTVVSSDAWATLTDWWATVGDTVEHAVRAAGERVSGS